MMTEKGDFSHYVQFSIFHSEKMMRHIRWYFSLVTVLVTLTWFLHFLHWIDMHMNKIDVVIEAGFAKNDSEFLYIALLFCGAQTEFGIYREISKLLWAIELRQVNKIFCVTIPFEILIEYSSVHLIGMRYALLLLVCTLWLSFFIQMRIWNSY